MTTRKADAEKLKEDIRTWYRAKAEGLDQAATALMQKACDWFCKASDVGDCTARVLRDMALRLRREAEDIRKENDKTKER